MCQDEEAERASAEMAAVKADNSRWKARVTQLIEKHQKISPEQMKKVRKSVMSVTFIMASQADMVSK